MSKHIVAKGMSPQAGHLHIQFGNEAIRSRLLAPKCITSTIDNLADKWRRYVIVRLPHLMIQHRIGRLNFKDYLLSLFS